MFVDKTLWTLSDAAEIFRVTEADHELVKVPTEDPALDLWIKDGIPAIVTSPRSDEAPLTIRRWTGEEFRALVGISTKQERFLGVSSNGEPATILTTRRMMDVVGNTIRPRFNLASYVLLAIPYVTSAVLSWRIVAANWWRQFAYIGILTAGTALAVVNNSAIWVLQPGVSGCLPCIDGPIHRIRPRRRMDCGRIGRIDSPQTCKTRSTELLRSTNALSPIKPS